ncbi:DUF3238 domain-containing protein [Sporosarcina jeotgali]|uniref:DUF3238 domain-containing protein n=1 Tax=Sporosarcina jeotgali TaxID=3020056 RepID=A0ABZ0KUQ2_9BACL|nr:DUF3238 domain-containing protein [Sporosarcina sp. B2O-1]WOV84159.1 DUF3238 domain-containing protein [Sporosarcina sp. B2O-1]
MSQRFEITSVTHEVGRIAFDWDDAGGTYHVYKDGEHIYEGTSPDFQDTDILADTFYKYTIERHVNDEVKDVIVMQTSTFSVEKNKSNPLQSLVMTTIIARTQIALSWERLSNTETYTIYRNGEQLAQVDSNRYIDRDFNIDEPITYAVYCERPIAQSEETFNNARSFIAKALGVFLPEENERPANIEGFTIMKSIDKPTALLASIRDYHKPEPVNHWSFRYKTFLEDDILENPNVLSPNRYFKGDNRKFDPESDNYRTFVDIEITANNPDQPITFTKKVGESVAYGLDKEIRDSETATDEGIFLKQSNYNRNESRFILEHAVGNPLTTAPDINYEVMAVLRRNGTFDLTGFHDQSPNHEIYLKKGETHRWIPVHQSRSEGLAYMSGVTAYQYWRFSNIN